MGKIARAPGWLKAAGSQALVKRKLAHKKSANSLRSAKHGCNPQLSLKRRRLSQNDSREFITEHPGTNYYQESLGGRYFTAVYAEAATVKACAESHNRNPGSPKKDFKTSEVMGGLIVRVSLEF